MNEPSHPAETRRLVHIHIPKTAGTAVRIALKKLDTDGTKLFPHYEERKFQSEDTGRYQYFSGHIGYETASRLEGDIVTLLREPVDRFISVYFFWRELWEKGVERSRNTNLAQNYGLDEFVKIRDEPTLVEEFDNRMMYQLALGHSMAHRRVLREANKSDRDILTEAEKHLSTFAVVGIQEQLAVFERQLRQNLGLSIRVGEVNRTENRPGVADVRLDTRRQIQSWVYADLELYHAALRQISLTEASSVRTQPNPRL